MKIGIKLIFICSILVTLFGCKGMTETIYNYANGGSDQYYAELKNIDIKKKCANDNQTKITCIQTLLYKREEARHKLNLPELYKDNSDAKKVYASKNEDYIPKPVVAKNKLSPVVKDNNSTISNNDQCKKNDKSSKQSKSDKPPRKIEEFAQDYVEINNMYYSTTKKDLSYSPYIKKCTQFMMTDAVDVIRQQAVRDGKQKEFAELKDRIYTAEWNYLAEFVSKNVYTDAGVQLICEIAIRL